MVNIQCDVMVECDLNDTSVIIATDSDGVRFVLNPASGCVKDYYQFFIPATQIHSELRMKSQMILLNGEVSYNLHNHVMIIYPLRMGEISLDFTIKHIIVPNSMMDPSPPCYDN